MVPILLALMLGGQPRVEAVGLVPPLSQPLPQPQEPAPVSYLIHVTVTAGDETLVRKLMRLVPGYPASYSESLIQAPMVLCPGTPGYEAAQHHSLRINLGNRSERPERVHLSVNWDRPLPPSAVCQLPGSRGVQLTNTFDLVRGEPITFYGDAGLQITLRLL